MCIYASIMRFATRSEYKISDFPISSLSIVFLNSLVYFIIGLIMFNYFEKIAMKKGIQS
jgi:hypothetical protein